MGTTANLGIPYPENTDLVTNGAAAMKAMAEALDWIGTGFSATKAGNWSLPNAAFGDLSGVEVDDHGAGFDPATGIYTVPRAGIYHLSGSIVFRASDTGGSHRLLVAQFRTSSAGTWAEAARAAAPIHGGQAGCCLSAVLKLAVGNQVKLQAYQDCGAAMNMPAPGAGTLPNALVSARMVAPV